MKDKIIHSKFFTILLITVLLVAVTITGTYAWFTWSSTENTTLTMSIGKLADVVFNNGNNIVTDKLAPVFNYEDGEKTNFEIINRDTTGAILLYYALVGNDASNKKLISTGSFEGYNDGDSIILYEGELPSGSTYHELFIYIDSNEENSLSMMNLNFSGNVEVIVEEKFTLLDNFNYYLGSESTTIDSISYYSSEYNNTYNVSIEPITISSNEILLTRYNGTDPNVVVPNTYTIDGITYNTVILSSAYIYFYDESSGVELDQDTSIFMENTLIKSVTFGNNIKSVSTYGEKSLTYLFSDCSSLITVNNLPKNIVEMDSTFAGCTSLTTAPEIPSSVTNMASTFWGCTSLTTAPEIPSSVTNMASTFRNCTSLTGTLEIKSANVSNANYIFGGTSKPITVYAPSGSTTYTKLNSLNTSGGMPANVTLQGR